MYQIFASGKGADFCDFRFDAKLVIFGSWGWVAGKAEACAKGGRHIERIQMAMSMMIDSVLKKLTRYDLAADQRSACDALEKRLRDWHEAIRLAEPNGFDLAKRQ